MNRPALALRWLGLVALAEVITYVLFTAQRSALIAQLRARTGDVEAIIHQLDGLEVLGNWSHGLVCVASALGLLGLALALPVGRARNTAFVATGLGVVALAWFAYLVLTPDPVLRRTEPLSSAALWRFVAWNLAALVLFASWLAALLAARAGAGRSRGRGFLSALTAVTGLVLGAAVAMGLWLTTTRPSGEGVRTLFRVMHSAGLALFVGAAVLAAAVVKRGPDQDDARTRALPTAGLAAPLRLLGWSFVLRLVLAVGGQALTASASASRDYEAAATQVGLFAWLGAAAALLMLAAVALVLARAWATLGNGAIALAVALLGIVAGAALDFKAAGALGEVLEGAARIRRATSFWNMPSLRRIEELQRDAQQYARLAVAFGVVANLTLAAALRALAARLERRDMVGRGTVLLVAMTLTGGLALGLSVIMSARRGAASEWLWPTVLLLACVGIWMLVLWLGLVFGLARAADERAETAELAPADVRRRDDPA